MSSDQPHFLARKIVDLQRQAARGFDCPLCAGGAHFASPASLKEHAGASHPELFQDDPNGAKWHGYFSQSKARTQTIRKPAPERPLDVSARSSENESMKPQADDSQSQVFSTQSRPLSASGAPGTPGYTESFGELSLAGEPVSPAGRQPGPANPLKRTSAESPTHKELAGASQRPPPRSRRGKAQPGSVNTSKDPDHARRNTGAKRLFDPSSDSPSFGNSTRRHPEGDLPLLSRPNRPDETQGGNEPDLGTKVRRHRSRGDAQDLHATHDSSSFGFDSRHDSTQGEDSEFEPEPELLLQPETRPISHEQLVVEVKGIYAGLVMVEAKCIDVDEKQAVAAQEHDPAKRSKLSSEQWSALIALHKTLLHEHHDFFLASQHPAASPALSKLAGKYSMPARMWRHGIHAFLEVLRHRLPDSLDHMLAFIYIAYSMMALLYETVEAFQDTWIECLGDLGRYRMAIEDDDVRDREVWSGVAKFWYGKAADRNPKVGRLYHHLAILARPFTIAQLALYCRSLTCITPFESARSSIMTMFTPVLEGRESVYQRSSTTEIIFITAHAVLFTGQAPARFNKSVGQLTLGDQFSKFISRTQQQFKEIGVCVGVANIAALHSYNATSKKGIFISILRLRFEEHRVAERARSSQELPTIPSAPRQDSLQRVENLTTEEQKYSLNTLKLGLRITFETFSVALGYAVRNQGDRTVYPMVHFYLIFIWHTAKIPKAMELIERDVPWTELTKFLNHIVQPGSISTRIRSPLFPAKLNGHKPRPLPEDFIMRELLHTEDYFPHDWFKDTGIDDEERILELPSFLAPRVDRILWASYQIARHERCLAFDENSHKFVETSYARSLSPWNTSDFLEPMADQLDTVMTNTSEFVGSKSDEDSQDLLTTVTKQELVEEQPITKTRTTHPPKFILKREPKSGSKRDIEMEDPITVKQELSSPTTDDIDPNTEEWLTAVGRERSYPVKIDPNSPKGGPEDFEVFDVLEQPRDPTKS